MNPEELIRVSITAIIANRLRSALTILGIVIGVTSVILLVALVTGLQTFITDQISGLGSNIIFVIPGQIGGGRGPGGSQVNRLTNQDAIDLKNGLQNQAEVSPAVSKAATLQFSDKTDKNVTILGSESNLPKIIKLIKITQGRFLTASEGDSGKKVVVIGPTVVTNLFGSRNPISKTITIANVKYQVIGVMASRGSSFGVDQDNTAVIPLGAATTQFGINNLNAIYISANTADTVNQVQAKATDILKKRLSTDDFTIETQAQTLSTVSQITGVLTLALGGIAAISLIVGGIGVMNIMLVSVTERTREIGLRKALGARPADIRRQFLIEAIVLSSLGGIIGIMLGYLLAFIAARFITTTVPLWSVALSFGFSMLVGVVFGVAPAIRASRLDPITALRYE